MLDRDGIDALFPPDLPGPEHWEERYPPRNLPPGAMVTRFCPSPTGFAHLDGVYVAMLDKDLARQSGGDYFIRIEDTDQARTVEDATAQLDTAFGYFGVTSDETDETGASYQVAGDAADVRCRSLLGRRSAGVSIRDVPRST